MPSRTLPGIGLTGFWDRGADYKDLNDINLRLLSALVQCAVETVTTALPGSAADGTITVNPATGAITVRDNGAWVAVTPKAGWLVWVRDVSAYYRYTGSAWTALATGGGAALLVRDEGTSVDTSVTSFNFVGAGVTATTDGSGHATVTIPGGGGSGSSSEATFIAPPAASTWIQQNFDATKTHLVDFTSPVTGVRLYEDPFAYGNVNSIRYALRPIPGTRWQVTARLRRHTRMANFMAWGLVVRDSANGRSKVMGFDVEAAGVGALNMFGDTSYQGYEGFGGNQLVHQYDIWLRLKYDGTDCTMWHSFDGVYFTRTMLRAGTALWPNAAGSFSLSNAATHIGFGYNINNAGGTDLGQEVDLLSWQAVALP